MSVVLASADFHPEVTTTVLWLNQRGLDIRCVRMKPYKDAERLIVDIQQVIPLPEAAEYQVRIRVKEQRERAKRQEQSASSAILARFLAEIQKYAALKTDLHEGCFPKTWAFTCPANASVASTYFSYSFHQGNPRIEFWINRPKDETKRIFDQLVLHRDQIDRQFGEPLDWQRNDDAKISRISLGIPTDLTDETEWPDLIERLVDAMIRFEAALRPHLDKLTV